MRFGGFGFERQFGFSPPVKAASGGLGPELVVNGEMDGATGWSFSVVDGSEPTMAGAMVFTASDDVGVTGTLTGIPANGNYRASWTEGSVGQSIQVGNGGSFTLAPGAGSEDFSITGASVAEMEFRVEYTGGTLDGLSIKRIL